MLSNLKMSIITLTSRQCEWRVETIKERVLSLLGESDDRTSMRSHQFRVELSIHAPNCLDAKNEHKPYTNNS